MLFHLSLNVNEIRAGEIQRKQSRMGLTTGLARRAALLINIQLKGCKKGMWRRKNRVRETKSGVFFVFFSSSGCSSRTPASLAAHCAPPSFLFLFLPSVCDASEGCAGADRGSSVLWWGWRRRGRPAASQAATAAAFPGYLIRSCWYHRRCHQPFEAPNRWFPLFLRSCQCPLCGSWENDLTHRQLLSAA